MINDCDGFDRGAIIAAAELVGRSGGRHFDIGYLHDDVPIAEAAWYASAQYRGTRITCENQPHPVAAAEGLARQILDGAQCQHCGRLVTLDPAGAYAVDRTMIDGSRWTSGQQRAAGGVCRWQRQGPTWIRGCPTTPPPIPPRPRQRGRKRR
jgi:hypothetical protein